MFLTQAQLLFAFGPQRSSSAFQPKTKILILPNPSPMLRWEIWHPAPGIQNQFIEIIICLMAFSASAQKWLASAHGRMPLFCCRLPTHQIRAAGACSCLQSKLQASAVTDACQQPFSEPSLVN